MSSMPRKFKIEFTVPENMVGTIVTLLAPEIGEFRIGEALPAAPAKPAAPPPVQAVVDFASVAQDEGEVQGPAPMHTPIKRKTPRKVPHHIGPERIGKIIKGIFADGGVHTVKEIGAALSEKGFVPTSASPSISQLRAIGMIERIGEGTYTLTEKARAEAADAAGA